MEKADVIITGGGIAGLSAALASVRKGLKTILVEKNNFSGGIARDCFHTYICGLFKNDKANPYELANQGICSEVFNILHNNYGDSCLVNLGRVEVLAFIQNDLWNFYNKELNKYKNTFLFLNNHECVGFFNENNTITGVKIRNNNHQITIKADSFIDASGCSIIENRYNKSRDEFKQSQLGGYCFLLEGAYNEKLPLLVPYTARGIVEKYHLDNYLKYINMTYNNLSEHYVLKFSVETDEDIEKCQFIYQKLKEGIREFKKIKFIRASNTIHLRSCHLQHFSIINENQNEKNSKCIVSYWPSEKWDRSNGPEYEYVKQDAPFKIYNSSLTDKKYNNLFLAGKSIRVTERVHSSARVMGISMATGENALLNAFNYLKKI